MEKMQLKYCIGKKKEVITFGLGSFVSVKIPGNLFYPVIFCIAEQPFYDVCVTDQYSPRVPFV